MFNRFNNAKHTRWMMSQICIEQVHRSGQLRLPTSLVASLDAVPVMCCVPPHEIEKGRDPNPACTAGCTHTYAPWGDTPKQALSRLQERHELLGSCPAIMGITHGSIMPPKGGRDKDRSNILRLRTREVDHHHNRSEFSNTLPTLAERHVNSCT